MAFSARGEFSRDMPRWALPLEQEGLRYLAAYGGRGSGKSHEFAERCVERMVLDPNAKGVGIREIQKSLRFSAKALVEQKIQSLGVGHMFEVQRDLIKRNGGDGLMIFQGMQDHTAESIKSLEDFDFAWPEEAAAISDRSWKLLRPTIRKPGSQILATWNPDQPEDAIDKFFRHGDPPPRSAVVEVNYGDNPYPLGELEDEIALDLKGDPETFAHVWLGAYNTRSDAQVFGGKYSIREFEPEPDWDGPYFGADFGFAQDPTILVKLWVAGDTIFWEKESGKVGLEIDRTGSLWLKEVPESENATVRGDSARPETISYLKRHSHRRIEGVEKWRGSVEDGVEWMRKFRHVVHPQCVGTAREFRLYRYKTNKAGDILAQIEDANNHRIDAGRYALAPLIKRDSIYTLSNL